MVTLTKRTPDEVCRAIEKNKLELLPTSPTFLHMLLLGRYYEKYDLTYSNHHADGLNERLQ